MLLTKILQKSVLAEKLIVEIVNLFPKRVNFFYNTETKYFEYFENRKMSLN